LLERGASGRKSGSSHHLLGGARPGPAILHTEDHAACEAQWQGRSRSARVDAAQHHRPGTG